MKTLKRNAFADDEGFEKIYGYLKNHKEALSNSKYNFEQIHEAIKKIAKILNRHDDEITESRKQIIKILKDKYK